MEKRLLFKCRGKWYTVNEKGHMAEDGADATFSGQWIFLGVSFHHWRNGIDTYFSIDTDPKKFIGGRVWDKDHGTMRTWGGKYNGKLPKIESACREDIIS